jgi:pyruvyl transferase EpsI
MNHIKKSFIPLYQYLAARFSTGKLNLSDKPNAIMFLSPDYGNIGDLAIGYTQQRFLEKKLPEYNVISIPVSKTYKYLNYIKKNLKKGDLLFLVGGGSFGDLYPKADFGRTFLVKYFKDYPVCFFPQTMVFRKTPYGNKRRASTQRAFSQHNDLTLVAREKISFEAMKKTFTNPVKLSPDIVLSLLSEMQTKPRLEREGAVFTLRTDAEKLLDQSEQEAIIDSIKRYYNQVSFRDTTVEPNKFHYTKREDYVFDMLETYRKAELVVTDRLHGMIFAVITGTPCIVLQNSNHKIKATYEDWLQNCNYVTLLEQVSDEAVSSVIDRYKAKNFNPNYSSLTISFEALTNYLKQRS